MGKILLIGDSDDPHLISIQKKTTIDCVFLSTSKKDLEKTEFQFDGNEIIITQNGINLTLGKIRSSFCFSPIFSPDLLESEEEKYAYQTWKACLLGVYEYLSKNSFFVNKSIENAIKAQNKISFFYSFKNCKEVKKPISLITNKKYRITDFVNEKESVIKTLHQKTFKLNNGENTMLLVKKVVSDDFSNFEDDNGESPLFIQKFIEKEYDVRVVLIGNKLMSFKIDASQSEYGKVDWRVYDLPNTPHEKISIPEGVKEDLLGIAGYFELDYCCIDLCVDKNNKYWVLDVNPFGKFMWIETLLEESITSEIALFLQRRIKHK